MKKFMLAMLIIHAIIGVLGIATTSAIDSGFVSFEPRVTESYVYGRGTVQHHTDSNTYYYGFAKGMMFSGLIGLGLTALSGLSFLYSLIGKKDTEEVPQTSLT